MRWIRITVRIREVRYGNFDKTVRHHDTVQFIHQLYELRDVLHTVRRSNTRNAVCRKRAQWSVQVGLDIDAGQLDEVDAVKSRFARAAAAKVKMQRLSSCKICEHLVIQYLHNAFDQNAEICLARSHAMSFGQ